MSKKLSKEEVKYKKRLRFLKEIGVFKVFITNIAASNKGSIITKDAHHLLTHDVSPISAAFVWAVTKQGQWFWSHVRDLLYLYENAGYDYFTELDKIKEKLNELNLNSRWQQ